MLVSYDMVDVVVNHRVIFVFFFKQKTAYEVRISDWSSDVCSSDLLAASAFEASGQQCISAQRIIVEAAVYDAFVEQFLAAAKQLKVGDPADPSTDLGPVVHARAANRIMGMIEEAQAAGGTLVLEEKGKGVGLDAHGVGKNRESK